jgi:phage terminase large subunit-like protein
MQSYEHTRSKWTNETLDDAMDIVENGTTSLWKGLGIRTYIYLID